MRLSLRAKWTYRQRQQQRRKLELHFTGFFCLFPRQHKWQIQEKATLADFSLLKWLLSEAYASDRLYFTYLQFVQLLKLVTCA